MKGYYRKAVALASLEKYTQAAAAFDEAFTLCPSDAKLKCQADLMREKAGFENSPKTAACAPVSLANRGKVYRAVDIPDEDEKDERSELQSTFCSTPCNTAFKGDVIEREHVEIPKSVAVGVSEENHSQSGLRPARRYHGNNVAGNTITFEPVGEAVTLFAGDLTHQL